jgi:hypothetical protein
MSVFLLYKFFEMAIDMKFAGISEGSSGVMRSATYIASSKFLSAMALLPRALSSSAEAMVKTDCRRGG